MFNSDKPSILLLRSFAVVSVVTLGLLSIIASGGGSTGDDPASSFADAGPDQSVAVGPGTRLDGSGSNTPLSDNPAEDDLSYYWTVLSSPPKTEELYWPETYVLEDVTTINPALTTRTEGEYIVQLKVTYGNRSAWDTVSVFAYKDKGDPLGIPPPNAKAGSDQFIKHGTLVTLDASGSMSTYENVEIAAAYDDLSPVLPHIYSWYMNKQPAGASSSLSATDVVKPSFIAEYNPNDSRGRPKFSLYETRLHVTDNRGLVSRPVHVKTYVFPPEGYVYPTPVAGPNQYVTPGSTVQLDGSASFDVDDRALTYNWKVFARPPGSNATLTGAGTATPSLVTDQDGVYVVQLQVGNVELSSFRFSPYTVSEYKEWGEADYAGNDRVVIYAQSEFFKAVANAGPDQILPFTGPAAIPLDGSGSYHPSGGEITYRWYLIDTPAASNASIDTPGDTEPDSASLLIDSTSGNYVVGLKTSSAFLGPVRDHVVITLTQNNSPTAAAGDDQAVSVGDSVTLNGSASNAPDGNPLDYTWSLASAPGLWGLQDPDGDGRHEWMDWPALSNGIAIAPTFTPDQNGEYRLRLTVNDGEQSSVADEVIITASGGAANTAPIADAGADQSVTVGSTVNLDGGDSSDPDNNLITFAWTIERRPLTSTATINLPSSETPSFVADVVGSYDVQLIVNDGIVNSAPDTMTVTAAAAGACANPLTLTHSLPFAPDIPEMATNIQIDASGPDTLSAVTGDAILDPDVYQATISNLGQADFVMFNGANWVEIDRSHTNPISDSDSPWFVVRNIADNIYYKINVDFTDTGNLTVQIDALSGCRCGSSAEVCPP